MLNMIPPILVGEFLRIIMFGPDYNNPLLNVNDRITQSRIQTFFWIGIVLVGYFICARTVARETTQSLRNSTESDKDCEPTVGETIWFMIVFQVIMHFALKVLGSIFSGK